MYVQDTPGMVQTLFGEMTESQFREFRMVPMGFPTGQTAQRYREITGRDPVCNVDGFGLACMLTVKDLIDRLTSVIGDRKQVEHGVMKALGSMTQVRQTTQTVV